ncbi:alpha/beta hydrolase [Cetobacterium sp.]|uniref:alpha/beta hydrolase n=1 Tax=Cetobacterium sp. TaxID=2071632 RepID=UPI003F32A018
MDKFIQNLLLGSTILICSSNLFANTLSNGDVIKIWPNLAPGSEHLTLQEEVIERSKEPEKIKDRAVTKVITPTLTAYLPENPNGTALLVTPGGGYSRVVLDKEADELAPWLNTKGITFFVLRYRLPGDGHTNKEVVPLQDAQRAIRIIRYHAKYWNIHPEKIGILGFSAGGHLAASLSTKFNEIVYEKIDTIDEISARPDFQILGYPVISMKDPFVHKGSRKNLIGDDTSVDTQENFSLDLKVTSNTPETFIMHATDDKSVAVENSINYYLALKSKGIPVEMHIYEDGGHGYSIRGTKNKSVAAWTDAVTNWLKNKNYL